MKHSTNFAEEFRLYENLFVESTNKQILLEKSKAEVNNLKQDFDYEVEKISGGKLLSDIAGELVSNLRTTIDNYRVYALKTANHTTSNDSIRNSFEAKSEQILKFYLNLIKTLKKPNNFTQAQSSISSVAEQILGDYLDKSSAYKNIEKYHDILTKISEIQADKKIKAQALVEYHKVLINELTTDYQALKSSDYSTLFD